MRAAFNEKGVNAFLEGLVIGKERLGDLPSDLPKIATATPWDGKDAAAPVDDYEDDEEDEKNNAQSMCTATTMCCKLKVSYSRHTETQLEGRIPTIPRATIVTISRQSRCHISSLSRRRRLTTITS
eukprot:CAMPEP_0115009864 /NCGR_PEP_ID=MMETSP0216-20121206/22920_1 /TAXON_ID=223996 /ORGANISM="Protocruzia adherens, Strain Boccale" /LENGTH=125 /DNA_ID=CAMNT_0002377861 /DNA_START=452 /DNA_END=826 /DNA_ORIENTATION=+